MPDGGLGVVGCARDAESAGARDVESADGRAIGETIWSGGRIDGQKS